jgi:membrane-associated protease RseP (regulator of RpoE activity)
MAEEYGLPDQPIEMRPAGSSATDAAIDVMIRAAREVMTVRDTTRGPKENPIRIRGTLTMLPAEAFTRLRPQFEAVGHTPLLRHEDDVDVIAAMPAVFEKVSSSRVPRIAIMLFFATILTVFTTGFAMTNGLYGAGLLAVIVYKLTGSTSMMVFPSLLPTPDILREAVITGMMYTAAILGILGSHEMGHYLVARYYKVHTTPPFFIPMPLSFLGTMGAVIAMREPAPNRRIQFDIGIAGPLAGLIIAIPVMLIGLNLSEVMPRSEAIEAVPQIVLEHPDYRLTSEGQSIVYLAMKYLVFGRILPQGDTDVWIHPVAFAAWAGLLVTALNLLPVGQLDGGHILFGLLGDRARKWRIPILLMVVLFAIGGTVRDLGLQMIDQGTLSGSLETVVSSLPGWVGWWLWAAIIYFLLRDHAPVLDEITGLDTKRRVLGIAMLVIFVLIFIPTPLIQTKVPPELIGYLPFF